MKVGQRSVERSEIAGQTLLIEVTISELKTQSTGSTIIITLAAESPILHRLELAEVQKGPGVSQINKIDPTIVISEIGRTVLLVLLEANVTTLIFVIVVTKEIKMTLPHQENNCYMICNN